MEAVAETRTPQTLLAVAHRLSTLDTCDRILVLDNGKIVQDGTPAALRAIEGPFRAMWYPQVAQLAATRSGSVY